MSNEPEEDFITCDRPFGAVRSKTYYKCGLERGHQGRCRAYDPSFGVVIDATSSVQRFTEEELEEDD